MTTLPELDGVHAGGDDEAVSPAPKPKAAVGPLGSQPVRTLLLPIVLAALVAAGQAFIAGADTRAILLAVIGALVLAAQEIARKLVTPLTVAKDDTGRPLVPAPIAGDPWLEPDPAGEAGLTTVEILGLLCLAGIIILIVLIA